MMKAIILLLHVIIVHSFWVSNSLVCRFEAIPIYISGANTKVKMT